MILRDHDLRGYNTFGVAAKAAYFCRVDSLAALDRLRETAEFATLPRLVLGGGSNLLLTRDYPGIVLQVAMKGRKYLGQDDDSTYVEAAAGENWHELVGWTLDQGWAGLENLSLIPGSVGASPIQNIGAYGVEMKDLFDCLVAVDLADGSRRGFDAAACEFAYRDSVFKRGAKDRYLIASVTFRLPRRAALHLEYGEVRAELQRMGVDVPGAREVSVAVSNIRRRRLPDPAVTGNAGSFFKNPLVSAATLARIEAEHGQVPNYPAEKGTVKLAAGWLIERCGWKGKTLGRAGVHDQHALVLVNRGGASGAEIWALARAIQESVRERFGLELEPEPLIL